jgi:hypothetical protein
VVLETIIPSKQLFDTGDPHWIHEPEPSYSIGLFATACSVYPQMGSHKEDLSNLPPASPGDAGDEPHTSCSHSPSCQLTGNELSIPFGAMVLVDQSSESTATEVMDTLGSISSNSTADPATEEGLIIFVRSPQC